MIILFEKFKNNIKSLRINDYVICHDESTALLRRNNLNKFIDNNVGRYVEYDSTADFKYVVKYENIPINLRDIFQMNDDDVDGLIWFDKTEILKFSKNKEDLEIYLQIKKYNL